MPVGRRWDLLAARGCVRSVAAGNPHDVVWKSFVSAVGCQEQREQQEQASQASQAQFRRFAGPCVVLTSDGRVSGRRNFRVGAVFPSASPRTSPPVCSARPANAAHIIILGTELAVYNTNQQP
jgi:hypothetical protein